ncbi:MAG: DUF2029 domain-containing protein, partial [candidate division Zixibacteria bacterium]|nr:DUF2029 domain-containing protein [candidate division Zixibacteria bacterium]
MTTTDISQATSAGNGRIGRWILRIVLALFSLYVLGEIATNIEMRQWDFRSYYYAAEIDADGGNPYNLHDLNRRAKEETVLPFMYPPITLPFFRLFAAMSFNAAYYVWFVFKLLLAAALIWIWRRYFFPAVDRDLFAWFMLLGFGAAVYIDLVTGNITMLEQVLIWAGLVALLRERLAVFAIAIILASLFKFTPMLFLLLLPLLHGRRGWMWAVGSAGAFVAVLGVSYLFDTESWRAFLISVPMADEPGRMGNPSILSLARDIVAITTMKTGLVLGNAVAYVLYAIVGVFVVGLSVQHVRGSRATQRPDWPTIAIYLACLVFALIMPRFKTYSFILVVPPALYILTRSANFKTLWPLFALLVLTTSIPFPISPFIQVFWRYYPLLLVFLVWGL